MMHYSEVDGANSDEKFISVCKQSSDVKIIAAFRLSSYTTSHEIILKKNNWDKNFHIDSSVILQ